MILETADRPPPQTDILIVAVTPTELTAILAVTQSQLGRAVTRYHKDGKTFYDCGTIGGAYVSIVQSEMGISGIGAALQTVQKSINALHPKAIIMVGIAFGINPSKQRIGDVLISKQLVTYELQRIGQQQDGSATIIMRGDRASASPMLLDRFQSGRLDWHPPGITPAVHIGLLLSGEKLIDNQQFRDQLHTMEPEAVGGDMEGAGLYVAAQDQSVPWIVVKAICDWADGNKSKNKKARQKRAAQNAASLVLHVLQVGGIVPISEPVQPFAVPVVPQIKPRRVGRAPAAPKLMIGRDEDVRNVKERLSSQNDFQSRLQVITAMRGWPGVGKTTLASALAYDHDIARRFPDGVLWASLGQTPNLMNELLVWFRGIGMGDGVQAQTLHELSMQLRQVLHSKSMLLVLDDVWDAAHIEPFRIGGGDCALLITTRLAEVAHAVAPTANDVYVLGVLSLEDGLELLRQLAPKIVSQYATESRMLIHDLEGLPLAIQVAGRLLEAEYRSGLSIVTLLADIRKGATLIAAQAPADRSEVTRDTTPTIAALLQKSTDLLDMQSLECFAYLGAFAPKPATFDLEAMRNVWGLDEPLPVVRKLIDYGLLEPIEGGRYWLHAVLAAHARSFLTTD